MEFSKLILVVAGIANIALMIFACIMIWRTEDLTPLSYLITVTAAEVGTGTAFYYNKAKTENLVKLQRANRDLPIIQPERENDKESEGAVG